MGEQSHSRVGWGIDVHRFGGAPPLRLCGVEVDQARGMEATSDGDVAAHALADALLGAAALGDIGSYFPSDDPASEGIDSMNILGRVVELIRAGGLEVRGTDLTIVAETVRIAPHREEMRAALARLLGISPEYVSVKATTTDGLGFTGRDEGIAVFAVATLGEADQP